VPGAVGFVLYFCTFGTQKLLSLRILWTSIIRRTEGCFVIRAFSTSSGLWLGHLFLNRDIIYLCLPNQLWIPQPWAFEWRLKEVLRFCDLLETFTTHNSDSLCPTSWSLSVCLSACLSFCLSKFIVSEIVKYVRAVTVSLEAHPTLYGLLSGWPLTLELASIDANLITALSAVMLGSGVLLNSNLEEVLYKCS